MAFVCLQMGEPVPLQTDGGHRGNPGPKAPTKGNRPFPSEKINERRSSQRGRRSCLGTPLPWDLFFGVAKHPVPWLFRSFWGSAVGFPVNPLKATLVAGDLRTARKMLLVISQVTTHLPTWPSIAGNLFMTAWDTWLR